MILQKIRDAEREQIVLPVHDRQVFYDALMKVTRHQANEDMAWRLIDNSRETMVWLRSHGIRFIPMFGRQSFLVDGKHHFYGGVNIEAVGGGAGLVEAELARAAKLGCEIRYETAAVRLIQDKQRRITGLEVNGPDGYDSVEARAVVLACGGFESNPEMRARYLGPGWDLARVRGTRHNMGDGIRMALDIGARPYGNWSGCHSVGWDISAPEYGDYEVLDNFQKHSYPWGIMVNTDGKRFVDEGEDLRNHTYVKFGKAIMSQPNRTAVQIFDQKTIPLLRDEYRIRQVTKVKSDTIEGLAKELEIDAETLKATIDDFNAACQPGHFNPSILDGVTTKGLSPNDRPIPGLFAAGELVGGLFYENYPGGSGLMAGAVYGKIAGESAAAHVRSNQ